MEATTVHWLDQFPLHVLFLLTLALQLVFIEVGFKIGSHRDERVVKAQVSQVRAIMGAGLGLLAFMLAFTFATGQSHFETRVSAMVEETRFARNAFLQAEFLPEKQRTEARQLLRQYVSDRVRIGQLVSEGKMQEVAETIQASEEIQNKLWAIAVTVQTSQLSDEESPGQSSAFSNQIMGLIDMHVARLEAGLMNRISSIIWLTLYLTAGLSMLVMGYQAGLVSRRSPVATYTLAISFAAVMLLITDLDRPVMSLFHINNQVIIDLLARMNQALQ